MTTPLLRAASMFGRAMSRLQATIVDESVSSLRTTPLEGFQMQLKQ
jgi:hypothetical protein